MKREDIYKNIQITKITTPQQARYWIENGEIVVVPLTDAEAYVKKEDDNKVSITIQPKYGTSAIYENDISALDNTMKYLLKDNEGYVVKGAALVGEKASFLDRIADLLRSIIKIGRRRDKDDRIERKV